MLPRHHRLTRPPEISAVVSRGRKTARSSVVVYVAPREANEEHPRATVIVSKAVGNAPQRNRAKRRIRHVLGEMISEGTLVGPVDCVVRALPAVARTSHDDLRADIRLSISGSRRRG